MPPCFSPATFEAAGAFYTVPQDEWPPSDPNNPERYLNSAYWPAEERPDLEQYAIQDGGDGYGCPQAAAYLPHYCLLLGAQSAGYPITHTPQVGDIVEYPEGCATPVLVFLGAPVAPIVLTTPIDPNCTAFGVRWYDEGMSANIAPRRLVDRLQRAGRPPPLTAAS